MKNKKISTSKKKWYDPTRINHLFSKVIIVVCVAYMIRVIERVLDLAETTTINFSQIITAAAIVFGGELLLLAMKYTFGDAKIKKLELEQEHELRYEESEIEPEIEPIPLPINDNQDCSSY